MENTEKFDVSVILPIKTIRTNNFEDYFKLLRNDTTDNILADQLLIQIANNQKVIEQITFEHFQSVKNICDSVQKDKFDSIILEVIHKMKDNRPKPNRPEPNR